MRSAITLVLLLLISVNLYSQAPVSSDFFSPSVYYTYGSYSDGKESNSISAYSTLTLNFFDHIYVGFDKLKITDNESFYDQQFFAVGAIKNLYPFYLKFNYAHIKGEFDLNSSAYDLYQLEKGTYRQFDYGNLYNLGAVYNLGRFYFGFNYTFLNQIGYWNLQVQTLEPSIDWVIDPTFVLRVTPTFTKLTDNRNLTSIHLKLSYYPLSNLFFHADGFAGERAYYFNSELLTFFNLNQTQKNLFGIKVEYLPVDLLKLIVSYQYTEFTTHSINYISAGLKYSFAL